MTAATRISAPIGAYGVWPLLLSFTPLIFTRRKLGVRLLTVERILIASLALFCGPQFISYVHYQQWLYALPLLGLSFVMMGVGFYHRHKHWGDLGQGESWGTYELGVSCFDGLIHLPRRDWVPRFVDPIACLLFGWILSEVISKSLGWWIMLCAVCLAITQHRGYRYQLQRDLDTHDTIVESKVHGASAERYARPRDAQNGRGDGQGIPTGKGPDVTMNGRRPRRPESP